MPLRAIFWQALLGFGVAIPAPAYGASMSAPEAFSIETVALKNRRHVRKRVKADDTTPKAARRLNAEWEIRPSSDETLTDCLFRRGERIYCRHGRLSGGFESADKAHILVYAAGASIDPRHDKGLFVFDANTGMLKKEVSFKSGGPMTIDARPIADLLAANYQDGQDLVLEAYSFSGELRWQKRFGASRSPGHQNLGVSEDGTRILLGSVPLRISRESKGLVHVLSREGSVLQEISIANPRLTLNRRGSLAVVWNTSGYMVYPFKSERVVLRRECESPESEYCLVQDVSDDGRFIAAVTMKRAPRPEEKERLSRIDLVDVASKRIHTDSVDFPTVTDVASRFSKDNSLTITTEAEEVAYDTIP